MKRKLHIAYFLSVSSDFVGGADQTLLMQAHLMNSAMEVAVILPCDIHGSYNTIIKRKCEKMHLDCKVMKYDAAYSIKIVNVIGCMGDVRQIEDFVLSNKIDILHSVQINPTVEYISRKHKIPHVMNIYSLDAWEWQIPYSELFPQYVSSDSIFYLKKWKDYLQCNGKCVRVYSNMGRKNILCKHHKETIVLGTVGTICAYKNQLEVIKAVEKEINEGRNIHLLLAGEKAPVYGERCRDYINRHHLQDNIKVLGFMEDMSFFYEQIDALICGSKRESFPASIVEAMSCNIPIISTPVAGVPEILVDRENAYVTEDYSSQSLAEAIDKFLKDYADGLLQTLLKKAKQTYEQNFSAQAVKDQLIDLYYSMLNPALQFGPVSVYASLEQQTKSLVCKVKKTGIAKEDAEQMYSRALYFWQIKDKIVARECYIWGAGKWGRRTKVILDCLIEGMHIRAFVDEKKEGNFDGIDIIKKEDMKLQGNVAVFIGFVSGQEEVVNYLCKKGMEIMKDVFIIA